MTKPSLILQANQNNGRTAGAMLAYRESLAGGIIPIEFGFTRTTAGMERLSDGLWRNAPINLPRRLWDGTKYSYLFEPARTNSIRNNSMQGAVAGSPGVMPNNWGPSGTALTREIISTGFEFGLPYIDIRWYGVADNTSFRIDFELNTIIAASIGQTWTSSFYAKLISGTPDSFNNLIIERTSGGSFVVSQFVPIVVTTDLQRFEYARAVTGATTAFTQNAITFNLTNGASYDFTIRIAAPQMELGSSATSPIITAGSAVLRAADVQDLQNISSLIGQTEGVLYFEGRAVSAAEIISINRSTQNACFISTLGGTVRANFYANGVTFNFASAVNPSVKFKAALRYKANDFAFYVNGIQIGVNTVAAFTPLTPMKDIYINTGGYVANKEQVFLEKAEVYSVGLSNAELITLTTL